MRTFPTSDLHRWERGEYTDAFRRLGAHPNRGGVWFTVWAPRADVVSVVGDFNDWDPDRHPMKRVGAGLWRVYARGVKVGATYKFSIGRWGGRWSKTDPFAFEMEPPSTTGSPSDGLAGVVADLSYDWGDADWMASREGPETLRKPVAMYEVHPGSWKRHPNGDSYSYREMADPLADHALGLGFTHVELMPILEHPYYGSWGYQALGFFAPTFRYGSPADFKYLVDRLHQRGLGVILDWVPAHFAPDPQGLAEFDGEPLFEYADPLMREHPDWGTLVFDYGRPEVQNYLLSSARWWLEEYHIDGLRVDAVASMLYRDYSREAFSPNAFGGNENLEAITLLQRLNAEVFAAHPTAMTLAEESTAWPGVTRPTDQGGLGFLYKWNMGWMHDTLSYFSEDPVHRKYHHDTLTLPLTYAFSEQYALPLSHDEVVHGKGSLWEKMPGDDWQKAANLRLLYSHMVGHPGKPLLFMGQEMGQGHEWNHDGQVDWDALRGPMHAGVMAWVRAVFGLYREHPAFWDDTPSGFEWIDYGDRENSVFPYLRRHDGRTVLVVLNATPVVREGYRVGVPTAGDWRVLLTSDDLAFGGSGAGPEAGALVTATTGGPFGRPAGLDLTLPPLGALFLEAA
ncbi:MAG: 1,4-alpha-glucan branching protein GlgB [Bacteroidota bacterium]